MRGEPGSPIRGEATIEIDAPPDAVYDLVADITRMGQWSPESTGGRWLGPATGPAPGARFVGTNRGRMPWTTRCVVEVAEPGREFTFVRDRPRGFAAVRWSYRLEPTGTGTGTRVTERFEQVGRGNRLLHAMAGLVTGVRWADRQAHNQAGMERTLAALKAAAER
jgi:uncharacterized protein YndB with AHSA1/START domain